MYFLWKVQFVRVGPFQMMIRVGMRKSGEKLRLNPDSKPNTFTFLPFRDNYVLAVSHHEKSLDKTQIYIHDFSKTNLTIKIELYIHIFF